MKSRFAPDRIAVILALLHAYIGVRLLAPFGGAVQAAGALLLVASYALVPKGFRLPRGLGPRRLLARWLSMGFFSWLLVLTLARDASLLATGLAAAPEVREAWVRISALGVMLATPAITAIGFFMARRVAPVVEVEVRVAGLPAPLEGFTIAQISDVHVGPTIRRRFVERIVERVNGLAADMVAITGDLVDGPVEELARHTEPLARLASRHGTYFVTGNHEYYSGVQGWVRELRRLGAHVLLNEHVLLEHGGATLAVAGVTDYSAHYFDAAHRSDPRRAVRGAPAGSVKVLLAHQPRSARAAAGAGYHLQLSGHTHGGQFWPWNLFVRLQQPFTAGLNRLGQMWVYINRGTGYWGPPMRFGIPSEITLIRLVGE
ncbi:MAG TPA: metallophosphoesterase [Usitatibacter sp.]|nr:metallophosphoesterase [Usitatibacter sp.]